MAGVGVVRNGAAEALTRLATHRRMPVAVTMKAKGVFPETDPLFLGVVGFGTNQERKIGQVFRESDLVLLIGYDAVEALPSWQRVLSAVETLAAVDQAPGPQHYPGLAVEVVGDIGAILSQVVEEAGANGAQGGHDARPAARGNDAGVVAGGGGGLLSVADTFRALQAGCPEETVLCVDVGSHKVGVSALWISRRPGYIRVSNGLSAMGYALPAAIGTALARPGAPVAALMGDGGFYLAGFEIETALRLGVSLVAVVLCDGLYHRIQMKQADRGYPAVGVSFAVPDVVGVARALGAVGHRVADPMDLTGACRQAFARKTVTVLEVRIDPAGYLAL
jgi:acetolactate synthase-1/2/3 large subunit